MSRDSEERWKGAGFLLGALVLIVWGLGVDELLLTFVGLCLLGPGVAGVFLLDRVRG